jgi:hypothetical protein
MKNIDRNLETTLETTNLETKNPEKRDPLVSREKGELCEEISPEGSRCDLRSGAGASSRTKA